MKLLFDENLSCRLVDMLAREYPDSTHVRNIGMRGQADRQICDYARANGFAITSKDSDFRERSYLEGFPPRVIWLDAGNAGTDAIAEVLRNERERSQGFEDSEEASLLILSLGLNAP